MHNSTYQRNFGITTQVLFNHLHDSTFNTYLTKVSSNFLKILRVGRDKFRISYYFSFLHVMHKENSRKFSSSQKGSTTRRVGINIALKILSYVVKYYFWLVSIALVRNFPTWHFFSIPSPNSQC